MTAKHADFEALSAFVDGEAPEWADHVAGCPQCRATAAELRALSARVAAPAGPAPAAQREAAIAAALDAAGLASPADARADAKVTRLERRRERSWAMPAAAAVVVGLLGLSGVVLTADRSTDESTATFAGPALDSKAESTASGAPQAPVGDLGDVADAATLRSRAFGVAPPLAATGATAGRSASSSNSGAASDAPATATNPGSTGAAVTPNVASGGSSLNATTGAATGGSGGSATNIAPNAVSGRPCEAQARSREPGLGPVTYFATARQGAVPAYVLGFSSPTGPTVTLLMLAQDGCRELLRSAGP
jgi:hypothetical protein